MKKKMIYFSLLILSILLISTVYYSYAFFTHQIEEHGKLNLVVGTLDYQLESNYLEENQIKVEGNTTVLFPITITSSNYIDSKYELYYLLTQENSNLEIGYSQNTVDQPAGTIKKDESKVVTIFIQNKSSTQEVVRFQVAGGFLHNQIDLKEGNHLKEIRVLALNDAIMKDNNCISQQPNLTTTSKEANDPSGLYVSTDTNSQQPTYYFRGDVENNYVSFAGFMWRIIRINEDGTIRMIIQDATINNKKYPIHNSLNNLNHMYYSNCDSDTEEVPCAKKVLEEWYNRFIESNKNYSNQVSQGKYCEQAKVAYSDAYAQASGVQDMKSYFDYTPNFKCTEEKTITEKIGLITYDEVVFAGGYYAKASNYYLDVGTFYWTMSPAGVRVGSTETAAYIWDIDTDGIDLSKNNYNSRLRPVINLKKEVLVAGNGTFTNPYTVIQE